MSEWLVAFLAFLVFLTIIYAISTWAERRKP